MNVFDFVFISIPVDSFDDPDGKLCTFFWFRELNKSKLVIKKKSEKSGRVVENDNWSAFIL